MSILPLDERRAAAVPPGATSTRRLKLTVWLSPVGLSVRRAWPTSRWVAVFGSADEHSRIIEPIRRTVAPAFELVTPIPYTQLQQLFNGSAPAGLLAYEKALYIDELTDDVISVFTDFLPRATAPLSFVP